MKIAVIGSNIMDIAVYTDRFPEAGETKAANDFHIACGGKGANQAVAAAKLGTEVLMVTAIGHDLIFWHKKGHPIRTMSFRKELDFGQALF